MIGTVIIVLILLGVVIYTLVDIKKRANSGCCTTGDKSEKLIKVNDKNIKNYKYLATVKIEGMVCEGCVNRVSNAFHKYDDIYAKVDLSKKEAKVYMKHKYSEAELRDIVNNIGPYIAMDVKYEEG